MLEIILKLLEVSFWSGIAAVGFGILFNVPKSAVITIFVLGFGAGFINAWYVINAITNNC